MKKKSGGYKRLAALSAGIHERLKRIEEGKVSAAELDVLLDEVRELEERVIVLRYKAYERYGLEHLPGEVDVMKKRQDPSSPEIPFWEYEEEKQLEKAQVAEPEETTKAPPLDEVKEPPSEQDQALENDSETEEVIDENQISLIDSIEEVIRESDSESVNEQLKTESASISDKLASSDISSLPVAMNLNLRMGLAKALFGGSLKDLDALVKDMDETGSKEAALSLLQENLAGVDMEEHASLEELQSLIERRFP